MGGGGRRGEMTQVLYAHMNSKKKKKQINELIRAYINIKLKPERKMN
jgi:hypothetical protein